MVDFLIAKENVAAQKLLKLPGYALRAKINRFHLVIAKSQQSVEKIMKGYLLWHEESFNPFGTHSIITGLIDKEIGGRTSRLRKVRETLQRSPGHLFEELKWLEASAPKAPKFTNLAALSSKDILHNSEYPFFCERAGIVCPAEYFTQNDALRALNSARKFLTLIADLPTDRAATAQIESFGHILRDIAANERSS